MKEIEGKIKILDEEIEGDIEELLVIADLGS